MVVYRIAGRKFSADFSGSGAALYGGRWNKKGSPVLYTSESEAVALLETIVHTPPMLIPDLDLLEIEIPDDSVSTLSLNELPKNWMDYPAPTILSEMGERWIQEAKTLALKVPCCIIPNLHNYVLNCRHPEYLLKVKMLSQKPFHFDVRLKK